MKGMKILIACGALLTASQFASAEIVFDSVVVDETNSKIIVNGSGFHLLDALGGVDEVWLGGVNVTADATVVLPSEMTLDFSADTATAVPEKGSYLLRANDAGSNYTFAVYFDAAIIEPPVAGACPCEGIWNSYGSIDSPNGFADLSPNCEYESGGGSQIVVEFYSQKKGGQLWVLYSDISGVTVPGYSFENTCGLAIDEEPLPVDAAAHAACATYLQTNYFGSGAPICRQDIGFPPLFPTGL